VLLDLQIVQSHALSVPTHSNAIKEQLEQAGREMLETMSTTEGDVTVLPLGVVVHVLEEGPEGKNGVRPTKSSTVKIHYEGRLADGTIFDSTEGGEPVVFPLASVIPGWREGVLKMHEGETAMVGIPPEQAYGETGTPDGRIPGGSTLFFKIQLLEVMSAGISYGGPSLLGVDGKALKKGATAGGLLGADGMPLS
jgi:FKBP-type peptidyl-prolyl cis-trans isomerase FklB